MGKQRLAVFVVLLAVTLAAAGPPAWRWWNDSHPGHCSVCHRPEHSDSLVKAKPEGESAFDACCLSCVLSYQRQTGKTVRVLSVTEHETGRAIDPRGATFLVGSEVSPCQHDMVHFGDDKSMADIRWDRCLPSILAFASHDEAEAFRGRHGGELRTLEEMQGQ